MNDTRRGGEYAPRHPGVHACFLFPPVAGHRGDAQVALIAFTLFASSAIRSTRWSGSRRAPKSGAALREQLAATSIVVHHALVGNAARLNFGNSYQFKTPVIDLIADRFRRPWELALASALFSLLIGIPMGVYTRSIAARFFRMFLAASLVAYRCRLSSSAFC